MCDKETKTINPNPPADFQPERQPFTPLRPFRFWCQKVLPLVYDDSLSYYELLCKVVDYLNKTMEDVDNFNTDMTSLYNTYEELQGYVNNYFSSLDVQTEINNKLDNMVNDGTLSKLIQPLFDEYKEQIDSDIAQVKETITQVKETTNTQNSKISTLESRMDEFTKLPEGSTSGDAELIDARVGYNGTVYNTVGVAIRTQVSELNGDLAQLDEDFLNLDVVYEYSTKNKYNKEIVTTSTITMGKYLKGGTEIQSQGYAYTQFLEIIGGKEYSIGLVPAFGAATKPWYTCPNGISFYDKNKNYIGETSQANFIAPISAKYYKLNLTINVEGVSFDLVNDRCVLVYGDTLPNSYVDYENDVKFREHLDVIHKDIQRNEKVSSENKMHLTQWFDENLSLTSDKVFSLVIKDFYKMGDSWYSVLENKYETIKVTSKANKNVPPVVFFNGEPAKQTYIGHDNCGIITEEPQVIKDYEVKIPTNCTHIIVQSGWYVKPLLQIQKYITIKNAPISYSIDNDIISVNTQFKNDELKVTIGKRGVNNIVDFRTISVGSTTIYANSTDWHSPLVVGAVSNIDGGHPESHYFTGGNHAYNNTGAGIPTGRSDNLKFFADGKLLSNGDNGYCDYLRIEWENYVQGYNTAKEDGSGREIIKEIHKLVFDGIQWTSDVSYIPLENVIFEVLYGFQCSGTSNVFPNIRYVGGANRGLYRGNENNESGNKDCNMFIAYGDIFKLEMEVDSRIDLGDRHLYTGTKGCFNNDYGKAYFNFLSNVEMNAGDMYSIRGYYRFIPI